MSIAERYLFQAANAERVLRGLPTLRWDAGLFRAAGNHAEQMAARSDISHQFTGEPELAARARQAGVRFSRISENVAMAATAVRIHDAWMASAGHRANLLDPTLNSVAIRVVQRGDELYAVEDFARSVEWLTLEQQETAVARQLTADSPLAVQAGTGAARQTCAMETGYAGSRRPWFVMRYTTVDLSDVPAQLTDRLSTGRYSAAEVGACREEREDPFTSYSVAVLLYP